MGKSKKIIIHIFLWLYVLFTLYPIFFAFQNSFKTSADVISSPFSLPFTTFTLENYIKVWEVTPVFRYFLNSMYISVGASAVSMILASMTAFAIVRMRFKVASKFVTLFVGAALMIPGSFLLIPLYFLLVNLHLADTPWALLMPYITFGIPLSVFIVSAFLRSIPNELEEAGVMDGVSAFGLFIRIILPITMPALVTIFILSFLGNWNEFIMASFFLSSDKMKTLPVAMVAFRDSMQLNYGRLFASTMFSIVPVIVIYAFLQEKIIEGVTAGSIKG
ncbi:carbohydrate ABC transporter permease [Paenibacillus albiflavus]|uniref:Carbohydrate ABC transporter permease n=1 Tax=Paenibacillus albiflavus TaxID=2545760 RepID=A0A4R4EDB4_9BACL|nr:carbohydrate ABC transporter permease [Paenibacillus albiflavus]TCZ77193.1 carbohydrate ABC transporter permease [Paenibacillus albiflavus]